MKYWLLKTEPKVWSWDMQVKKGIEPWDGVRSYAARNNMKSMQKKDIAFFYHTESEKRIVGLVTIVKEYYPCVEDPKFGLVDVQTLVPLVRAVSLSEIKLTLSLASLEILKQPRLSVSMVTPDQAAELLRLARTKLNI